MATERVQGGKLVNQVVKGGETMQLTPETAAQMAAAIVTLIAAIEKLVALITLILTSNPT